MKHLHAHENIEKIKRFDPNIKQAKRKSEPKDFIFKFGSMASSKF